MRRCDGRDPNLVKADGKTPCDCGAVFDDVQWMVIWPHYEVRGTRTLRDPGVSSRLALVPPALDNTTRWGRSLRTIGRLTSAAELLSAGSQQHGSDNRSRADEMYEISLRLYELAEGIRAELVER